MALRTQIAEEEHVGGHNIFLGRVVQEMAARRPMTRDAFLQLTDVGSAKYDKYGERFMNVIRTFCHVAPVRIPPRRPPRPALPAVIAIKKTAPAPVAPSAAAAPSASPFFDKAKSAAAAAAAATSDESRIALFGYESDEDDDDFDTTTTSAPAPSGRTRSM